MQASDTGPLSIKVVSDRQTAKLRQFELTILQPLSTTLPDLLRRIPFAYNSILLAVLAPGNLISDMRPRKEGVECTQAWSRRISSSVSCKLCNRSWTDPW